jgi:Na+/H+ antiporter NhaD/arsenite permease-like protein
MESANARPRKLSLPAARARDSFRDIVLHHKPAILAILILTYAGIALGRVPGLQLNRTGIALLGAIGMMIFGGVTTAEVVSYINWPTIFLLFGFFVISAQLRLSGFYHLVAGGLSARLGHPAKFLFVLMAATAGFSSFLNHDIVCFVFTPIVGAALLRQKRNPVPFLVALAIASNIGSAATLIGNPQDMMIGQVAHLSFGGYILWSIAPVLFALAGSYGIIWMMARHDLHLADAHGKIPQDDEQPLDRAHTLKGLVILVVVIGLFFTSLPKEIVALAAAGLHLASAKFRTEELMNLIDWPVLVLFMGLFVVTGAFQSTGYGEEAIHWLAQGGFHLSAAPTLVATVTVLSNVINNSAAVMLLLKVIDLSHPMSAYILALANSFGGSLLIVGSVANIITVQQAQQLGIAIRFRDFVRLSVPATLLALGGLLLWCL